VNYAYAISLLVIWVPACIIAAFIWPSWMMSLQLGATLASDDVIDLMRCLEPGLVKRRYATTVRTLPLPNYCYHYLKGAPCGVAPVLQDSNFNSCNWKKNVEQPAAMLVHTMVVLSTWGQAMGEAIVCCTLFSLCLLPHAVARNSETLALVCVLTTTLPLGILWAPASVSSVCDDLHDQINDISFLGEQPKQRLNEIANKNMQFTVEHSLLKESSQRKGSHTLPHGSLRG